MFWVATLAAGAEVYLKEADLDKAMASAIIATENIVKSFVNQTGTGNCKEILGRDLCNVFDLVKYMNKVEIIRIKDHLCFTIKSPKKLIKELKGETEEEILFHKVFWGIISYIR